jgi:aspartyl-tRNA(Asn)/glutamyl-tRNA(Gln) amidotransferase subunit A
VSVAEGTCEIAIGSDTGGSIRIPASLNGVVGFKPTASRMPMDGIFPLSHTLDSIGPLARTVAECAAADAVLAGEPPVALQPASLFGLRFGLPTGFLLNDLEPAVAAAFEQSMRSIQAVGGRIVEIGVDDLLSELRAITRDGSIASVEAAAIHADWLIAGDTRVERRTREVLTQRLNYPAWRYLRMIERRNQLVAAMDHRLADIDAFILPTVPIVAPKIAPLLADDELADDVDGMLLRNPQIANQFDLTAISLPMPADGPPTGMMVVGRNRTDRRLLAIAAGVEGCLACV